MTKLEKVLREKGLYGRPSHLQSGLAKIERDTGIGRGSLSRHINRHSTMRVANLVKLANYLNMKIDDLIGETENDVK